MTTDTINKPTSLIGMEPVDGLDSYDDVPWYRKQWFALFPPFVLATIFIALTGTIYAKATPKMRQYSQAEVWRFTAAARTFFVVCGLLTTVLVVSTYWRFVG